jgi:hypothetical protein
MLDRAGGMMAGVPRLAQSIVVALWAILGFVSLMGIGGIGGWIEPFWGVGKGPVALIYGVTLLILMALPVTWIQRKVIVKLLSAEDSGGRVGAFAAFGVGVMLLPVFISCLNLYAALAGTTDAEFLLIALMLASAALSALISAVIVSLFVRAIRV